MSKPLSTQIAELLRNVPRVGAPDEERTEWLMRKVKVFRAIASNAEARELGVDVETARTAAEDAITQLTQRLGVPREAVEKAIADIPNGGAA